LIPIEEIKTDFDELADLVEAGASGDDRYDRYLASLVPAAARSVLDVGCGLGRLTRLVAAAGGRDAVGIDLSPRMIARARSEGAACPVTDLEGDFLETDFGGRLFDCIISAAALHHMPADAALRRMASLLSPGGRLLVHDLRRDAGAGDVIRSYAALAHMVGLRLVRTGRVRPAKRVRQAWDRHAAREQYLSLAEARHLTQRELPGSTVHNHWMWRYTLVWDKPPA
jgi:SAM-dependent methyltransferase